MVVSGDTGQPARGAYSPLPHNLPIPPTPLVGRRQAIEAASRQLLRDDVRLLTLTGPPGIGKTRLAIAVAAALHAGYANGVCFVDLAPIGDAGMVWTTLAHTLGVRDVTERAALTGFLATRRGLLVLDNFEQVIEAAPDLVELLQAAQGVKLLVTSRELLRLSGEHNFPVPPLALPPVIADQGMPRTLASLPPERLGRYDAVQLFVQRATALQPEFALTPENALLVAGICCRLDGLPLAIELAAARVRHLPLPEIYARLKQSLQLLADGTRDMPMRQRALRNTIAWSYNLLNEPERHLFGRLAVFRGGCSLEAVEAVCSDGLATAAFDSLVSLVDKSLIQRREMPGGEQRFSMLEMIHEFAHEQLAAGGELETLTGQHAAYFAELAARAELEIQGADQKRWFHRLETEVDNLRAALAFSLAGGDISMGIRTISSTMLYWCIYGRQSEGLYWAEQLYARLSEAPPACQVRLLRCAAYLSQFKDTATAVDLSRQAVRAARAYGDKALLAATLHIFGTLGSELTNAPEAESVVDALTEAQALFRELGDSRGLAFVLNSLGEHARLRGDDREARRAYEDSLAIFEQIGDRRAQYSRLYNLAFIAQHEGDHQEALRLLLRSLALCQELGVPAEVARELLAIAGSLGPLGEPAGAARLLGAASAFLRQSGALLDPSDQPEHDRNIAFIRAELGDEAFTATWAAGESMTLDEAAAYVRTIADSVRTATPAVHPHHAAAPTGELTRREWEVARLIAEGHSNREIAATLVVTERTAEGHVGNILAKLGFRSRAQISAWVVANSPARR